MTTYLLTSEFVGRGHPDKVADQISDAVLDAHLAQDPESKVACETLVKGQDVVLAGEITSMADVDFDAVVREAVKKIGYDDPGLGFSANELDVVNLITQQSPEINKAVVQELGVIGAGDQGIMFGYATNETKSFMPLHLDLSRRIIRKAEELMGAGVGFRPDMKAQVTVEYDTMLAKPIRVTHIVFSTQHAESMNIGDVGDVLYHSILPTITTEEERKMVAGARIFANPAGAWHHGGPAQDAGLTGRKIVVDNYGAACPVGGGAFSGKDPTKVDRSAAYAARHIAKNLVGAGLCDEVQVQLSYAIGIAEPISIRVLPSRPVLGVDMTFEEIVRRHWDLTPAGIIERYNLKSPVHFDSAAFGHFGRDTNLPPWDLLDMEELSGYSA